MKRFKGREKKGRKSNTCRLETIYKVNPDFEVADNKRFQNIIWAVHFV